MQTFPLTGDPLGDAVPLDLRPHGYVPTSIMSRLYQVATLRRHPRTDRHSLGQWNGKGGSHHETLVSTSLWELLRWNKKAHRSLHGSGNTANHADRRWPNRYGMLSLKMWDPEKTWKKKTSHAIKGYPMPSPLTKFQAWNEEKEPRFRFYMKHVAS